MVAASKKITVQLDRQVELRPENVDDRDDLWRACYVWRTFRFMFTDGSTADVIAARDDSDLRAAVLGLAHPGCTIAGVAVLEALDDDD